jgi:hypothetical protein
MIAQIKMMHLLMMMTKMIKMMLNKKKIGGIGDIIFNKIILTILSTMRIKIAVLR